MDFKNVVCGNLHEGIDVCVPRLDVLGDIGAHRVGKTMARRGNELRLSVWDRPGQFLDSASIGYVGG